MRALRRAAGREHVLAGLGTALLTAEDAPRVHRLAARAAADLLAGYPTARTSVIAADDDYVKVIESAGDLPDELRESLLALRTQVSLALDNVALNAELTRRASFDTLTGLANRSLLRERLDSALARSRRSGRPVAALLLDLNGFKQINDAYGHEVGDRVLAEVADRLRLSVRTEDVVGRLGSDEFVVLAEDLHTAKDAIVIAERIVANLARPVTVGRGPLRVSASLGVALSRPGADETDDLLKLAGVAMYTAKRGGDDYHVEGAIRVG